MGSIPMHLRQTRLPSQQRFPDRIRRRLEQLDAFGANLAGVKDRRRRFRHYVLQLLLTPQQRSLPQILAVELQQIESVEVWQAFYMDDGVLDPQVYIGSDGGVGLAFLRSFR